MKWVLGYIGALCVLVLVVCASIQIPTFLTMFYDYEYDRHDIPATIEVDKGELMNVTHHLLQYMRGNREDLVTYAHVGGEFREFFNEREKEHMADVRGLFDTGFKVRNVSFLALILLVLAMAFFRMKASHVLIRCCREVLTGFMLLTAILVVVVAIDFNRAFDIFHVLFFANDLWQLNPQTDLLVNIVPIGFFIDIAIFIGGLLAFFSLAVILGGTAILRRTKPPLDFNA